MTDNTPMIGGQPRTNDPELSGQRPLHCRGPMQRHSCRINNESFLVWVCIYCGTMDFDWDNTPVSKLPPGTYRMALHDDGKIIAFTTIRVKEPEQVS